MSLPRGVRYYILRNKVAVPLIPVDQLPLWPRGLPQQLEPWKMEGAGWKFVGETQEPPSQIPSNTFTGQPAQPKQTQYLPPDHDIQKTSTVTARKSQVDQASIPASAEGNTQRLDNHTPLALHAQPTVRQKEYCDFWMRTGECNYADFTKSREGKGCLYKHEMPTDRKKLCELGFPHGLPRWYKEKTAIVAAGDISRSQRRMAEDNDGRKLSDEPPASRLFNPSNLKNARNKLRAEMVSISTDAKVSEKTALVQDLISFDESPVPTRPSSPRVSISSSSASSSHAAVATIQPSRLLSQTMASVLRDELKRIKHEDPEAELPFRPMRESAPTSRSHESISSIITPADTPVPSPPPSVDLALSEVYGIKDDIEAPFSGLQSSSIAPTSNQITDKFSKGTLEDKPANKLSVGISGKNHSKASAPRAKRTPRPRKDANRAMDPVPRGRLSSSRYATCQEVNKVNNPCKGGKRRGAFSKGVDLQTEDTVRQRAAHSKERLTKQTTRSGL